MTRLTKLLRRRAPHSEIAILRTISAANTEPLAVSLSSAPPLRVRLAGPANTEASDAAAR
jgi:hypothetical protein